MSEKLNDDEIEKQINLLFEAAEREKYLHSRARETFDSIAGLWFLDDDIQSKLASIACNYIVSSFLLTALWFIYEQLRVDYDLPKISARDIGEDSIDYIQIWIDDGSDLQSEAERIYDYLIEKGYDISVRFICEQASGFYERK